MNRIALFALVLFAAACGSLNSQTTDDSTTEKWDGQFQLYHFNDGGPGVRLVFESGRQLLLQPMPGEEKDRWMYSIPGYESFDHLVVHLDQNGYPHAYGIGNTGLCLTTAEARRITGDTAIWKVDASDLHPVDPIEATGPECAQWLPNDPPPANN